jgi:hypothetical protein
MSAHPCPFPKFTDQYTPRSFTQAQKPTWVQITPLDDEASDTIKKFGGLPFSAGSLAASAHTSEVPNGFYCALVCYTGFDPSKNTGLLQEFRDELDVKKSLHSDDKKNYWVILMPKYQVHWGDSSAETLKQTYESGSFPTGKNMAVHAVALVMVEVRGSSFTE